MTTGIITVIANVSLALSFIAAFVFGVAQVKISARDRRERLTLETLRNFQSREFADLIQYITSDDVPKNQEDFDTLGANERAMIIQYAQEMEALGILVAENFIDIDLVDKTLGSFVMTSWNKYKDFILPARENDPYLSEYFQWLAERIEERMRDNPREPFYKTASNEVVYKNHPEVKQ